MTKRKLTETASAAVARPEADDTSTAQLIATLKVANAAASEAALRSALGPDGDLVVDALKVVVRRALAQSGNHVVKIDGRRRREFTADGLRKADFMQAIADEAGLHLAQVIRVVDMLTPEHTILLASAGVGFIPARWRGKPAPTLQVAVTYRRGLAAAAVSPGVQEASDAALVQARKDGLDAEAGRAAAMRARDDAATAARAAYKRDVGAPPFGLASLFAAFGTPESIHLAGGSARAAAVKVDAYAEVESLE